MENEIFNQKIIKGFLQNYPPKQWLKLIKLLIIHGIQELRSSINADSLTTSTIQTLVVNRKNTLITQKDLPDIKSEIQNLKKQLSYLDASVRLTQPPLDQSQIHKQRRSTDKAAPLSTYLMNNKNHPQQTNASQITRICNQILPSKNVNDQITITRSQRSRSPIASQYTKIQNTLNSVSSMHPHSTTNLDYSYSPTTLKSILPDNECISLQQNKANYDNMITPNTSNLSNSGIRCHSEDTQLIHRRGRQAYQMSAFSTMVKAPSNWRKGDDSVFDRSQSKIKYTDRVSSTDCTMNRLTKSEHQSDKIMTLQEAYIERMKKSEAIEARMIQRHQKSAKKMRKSSSLSSIIYPKWWKQMDPVEQPNSNVQRFNNNINSIKQQQLSYESRVDRSAPVDIISRNFNTSNQNARDISPPGTNTSFNISRISMNKSTNKDTQINIDTLDKKFQQIHSKKLFNGTASFRKYVQINPHYEKKTYNAGAPQTMPNKSSIQFTIPTETNPSNGGVKYLSQSTQQQQQLNNQRSEKQKKIKNSQSSQNFLTIREKKSNLAWNRCRQQNKKQQNQRPNKDNNKRTKKRWNKKNENPLTNVQSKIKRQLDFTRQVYRQTQKSNSAFIQIHCKSKQTTPKGENRNSAGFDYLDRRKQPNQEKLTPRDLQCSQTQQFDEQVQNTIQKAQKKKQIFQYQQQQLHERPQKQNEYYSVKPSLSPLSSHLHSKQNSLSSTIINNKAGADRYIFYDKASQTPSPKDFVSIAHQSGSNSSGQLVGYVPNQYQGQLFYLGNNTSNSNKNNIKLGIRRDSNAPQNQTAEFNPTSPSNRGGIKIDGSITSGANNYYYSASSQHQSYPGSNRFTGRSNIYRHGPQLSTNSGGLIDLQTMNMAPQNTSGPPTFQNRPASHKTKNSDPLQIVTGFLNNPVMMNMFSENRNEDNQQLKSSQLIKTDQNMLKNHLTDRSQDFQQRQQSQISTPLRFDSMNFTPHEYSNHQNNNYYHHQTTNSESKYLHPRRDSTPLDFYKQIDGKCRPVQLESYENNMIIPRSSIGGSSNNTNKIINDRGGVIYSSHASCSSGFQRYPTISQDTFDNMSSKNQAHQTQTPPPPWYQNSYLQSYSGTTNRSGTPANQMRGPSPATTINPVTMNTNSSVGTGGGNNQHQSRFQVSVQTNSKLNTDRNNLGCNYHRTPQNQQKYILDDYHSRIQLQSRGSSRDFTSGVGGGGEGSCDNYRSRQNSHERNNNVLKIHSKHSSTYCNLNQPKQKMLNSGSTTLSNYEMPEAMKHFFSKQNPINISSNRTSSQNQNYPSSRRQYYNDYLKSEGAGVYMNYKMSDQVAPLQNPPAKQKNNELIGNSRGILGQATSSYQN